MLFNPIQQIILPYLYLYGIGGVLFFSGIYLSKKSVAYNPENKKNKYWWEITILVFFYFMLIHAVIILAVLYF